MSRHSSNKHVNRVAPQDRSSRSGPTGMDVLRLDVVMSRKVGHQRRVNICVALVVNDARKPPHKLVWRNATYSGSTASLKKLFFCLWCPTLRGIENCGRDKLTIAPPVGVMETLECGEGYKYLAEYMCVLPAALLVTVECRWASCIVRLPISNEYLMVE